MGKKHQMVILRERGKSKGSTSSSSGASVRYVECQKNHAANIGGYAVDGCMEFLASDENGTNGSFVCAACGCHRNFHRRVVMGELAPEASYGPGGLKIYQCPNQCKRRCGRTQYKKPCLFFCNKCCRTCLCVPPGFYGNKAVCGKCYNNWKTKRGGPKCP